MLIDLLIGFVVIGLALMYFAWRRWRLWGVIATLLLFALFVVEMSRLRSPFQSWFSTIDWVRYKDVPWQALATIAGATVAVATLYVSTRQKDNEAERKAYRDEFADILDRFADKDNSLLRANAALRLADIAQRPMPGRSAQLDTRRFPLFVNASSQLATALVIEADPGVRASVVTALEQLSVFSTRHSLTLWRILIEQLYRANRSAFSAFTSDVARFAAKWPEGMPNEGKEILATFAPFCLGNREATRATIEWITATFEVREAFQAEIILRKLPLVDSDQNQPEPGYLDERVALEAIRLTASQLGDTRTALATALRRAEPDPLPFAAYRKRTLVSRIKGWRVARMSQRAHRPRGAVNLSYAFLAGADLEKAPLTEAWLQWAWLHGANLRGAQLNRANLRETRFVMANLTETQLNRAGLQSARLFRAELEGASLEGADLMRADLRSAQVCGANFKDAGLREAVLAGLRLTSTWKPWINPAATNFTGADWWDAYFFVDLQTRVEDAELKQQLSNRWPQPQANSAPDSLVTRFRRGAWFRAIQRRLKPSNEASAVLHANEQPNSASVNGDSRLIAADEQADLTGEAADVGKRDETE